MGFSSVVQSVEKVFQSKNRTILPPEPEWIYGEWKVANKQNPSMPDSDKTAKYEKSSWQPG